MDYFKENIIPGEVIVQLIAFLTVFFVLKFWAWKPILASLAARRERIRKMLEDAETAKGEAEKLRGEYSAHLQKIEEEARTKIQEAVEDGRRIARDIQQKARAEAAHSLEQAKESLDLEIAKARVTLKREIADLSIRVAGKILREDLSEARQQAKVLEIIEEIEKQS
jgi:F-type H+-transporting ATPase subunit b